ncbi:MAG: type III pantothenate kinase [Bacteroidales bacterium]|nr:type III pantothenate kinase [Bacteroidales bacterium]
MRMNLVIDIGNSHIKLATFNGKGNLVEDFRREKSAFPEIISMIEKIPAQKAIVSAVGRLVPEYRDIFIKSFNELVFLNKNTPLPVKVLYKTPETLGLDRIAAAAGAHLIFPGSHVLIIDMGTAITIDLLTARGEFLGGNISPGMQTRFRALHDYTDKLPMVAADTTYPEFGTDTGTAITAGVQQGITYEIDRYMDVYEQLYPGCKFIITGGDAGFFVSRLKRPIFAQPELVLAGLNSILEFNTSGEKQ